MAEIPNTVGAPPLPSPQHPQPTQQPSSSAHTPAIPHIPLEPPPQVSPVQAQPHSQSSAQNMPAPKQPQPSDHSSKSPNLTAAPPGAPGRNYLNTCLAPYLRTGMSNVLDAKPQYPLRYLGEYLIAQSLLHEGGTDEQGVAGKFIYMEHAVAVNRAKPGATTALLQGAEADGVDGVTNGAGHSGTGEDETGDKKGEQNADERVKDRKDTEMGGV